MWKCLKVCILLTLLVALAGCGAVRKYAWSVDVNTYQFRDKLASSYANYNPDPGYKWLVLDVDVRNNFKKEQSLNPFLDTFQIVSANGSVYSWQMHYNSIIGELPRFYPPQETRTGDIYFHVPEGFNAAGSKLVLDPWEGATITVSLKDVPVK